MNFFGNKMTWYSILWMLKLFSMWGNTHFGPWAPSGSCSTIAMSFSVQSPAERMCTLRKSSSGADVIVNGCHSSHEMEGQLRNTYWPTSILKPFFISCSSSVLEGRITIWGGDKEEHGYHAEKSPKACMLLYLLAQIFTTTSPHS